MYDEQSIHDSISQIASIRIQAELLLLTHDQPSTDLQLGLNKIIELSQEVQHTLSANLAPTAE